MAPSAMEEGLLDDETANLIHGLLAKHIMHLVPAVERLETTVLAEITQNVASDGGVANKLVSSTRSQDPSSLSVFGGPQPLRNALKQAVQQQIELMERLDACEGALKDECKRWKEALVTDVERANQQVLDGCTAWKETTRRAEAAALQRARNVTRAQMVVVMLVAVGIAFFIGLRVGRSDTWAAEGRMAVEANTEACVSKAVSKAVKIAESKAAVVQKAAVQDAVARTTERLGAECRDSTKLAVQSAEKRLAESWAQRQKHALQDAMVQARKVQQAAVKDAVARNTERLRAECSSSTELAVQLAERETVHRMRLEMQTDRQQMNERVNTAYKNGVLTPILMVAALGFIITANSR